MKNARKLISLLLAIATVMTIVVLPVSAEIGNDSAEPYVAVTKCESCGGSVPKTPKRYYNEKYKTLYDDLNSSHRHEYYGDFNVYTCSNCGKKYIELIEHRSIHCTTWPHCLRGLTD